MRTSTPSRAVADSYFDLVRAFPLRPIRSADELSRAIAVLLRLSTSKPEDEMDAGERDYVEALTLLVQRYEQGRRDLMFPKLTPIDRLKFLMREASMNISDLGRIIGSQPNASLALRGKRPLSKAHILKLARHFSVSTSLFME